MFSPILASDTREAADALAAELAHPRATFVWDEPRAVGSALAAALDVEGLDFAWDVYCLYAPDVRWDGDALPTPSRWAHQLGGGPPEHDFRGRVGTALETWIAELSGRAGSPRTPASPPPAPDRTLTFRAEDVRPLPEALLQAVLDSWEADASAGDANVPPDAATRALVAAELLRRMRAACAGFEQDVPRAIYHEGRILVVQGGSCLPRPTPVEPTDAR